MPILTLSHARLAYGHLPLLDDADLQLEAREHVALIGRNGTGKSSLLRVLAGLRELDDGERWIAPNARVALLDQEPLLDPAHTVYEAVALGLGKEGATLAAYHEAAAALAHAPDDTAAHARLDRLQGELDQHGWTLGHRIDSVVSRLELPADTRIATLSGGWKKRVALAQALAAEPDVLLLDEPTNHLDIATIAWLETLLIDYPGALVCVTHDRRFLDAIAQRIVELDRGTLRSYPGSFEQYRARKTAELDEEALADARFDKLLAQEEAWIRKGVEARRTRNEGRVLRLERLRRERAERRERLGQVTLRIGEAERSGKLVAELSHVTKRYGERVLIRDFDTRIMRGDRIGLIGPNGAGKSTLLRIILGDVSPDSGTVRRGTRLDIAYFDQLRETLDPDATLVDTISPGADFIEIGATRRHVMTYMSDFLFPPERARSPVRTLSGGERNRLLLARLFAHPANVLVLDEPTNDLDIETLELLEALVQDFTGTVFLVSHDRAFLDNVVTQTIAFEGDGVLREYAGGYSDWEAHRRTGASTQAPPAPAPQAMRASSRPKPASARTGLSFREQRELDALPHTIETLEHEIDELHAKLADPTLYRERADQVASLRAMLAQAEETLSTAYARWESLEDRAGSQRP